MAINHATAAYYGDQTITGSPSRPGVADGLGATTIIDLAATLPRPRVTVAPGGPEKGTAEKQFGAPDKMLCVLRGVALKT